MSQEEITMETNPLTCIRCQGPMSEGFLLDRTHPLFAATPLVWHADKPVHAGWTGTKIVQIKQRRVVAYRCDRCAYLEIYAP